MVAPAAPLQIGALLFEGLDQIDFTGPFEIQPQRPGQTRRGGGGLGVFGLVEVLERIPGLGLAWIGRAGLSESIRHPFSKCPVLWGLSKRTILEPTG